MSKKNETEEQIKELQTRLEGTEASRKTAEATANYWRERYMNMEKEYYAVRGKEREAAQKAQVAEAAKSDAQAAEKLLESEKAGLRGQITALENSLRVLTGQKTIQPLDTSTALKGLDILASLMPRG